MDIDLKDVEANTQNRLEELAKELHKEYGIIVHALISTGNISIEIVKICNNQKCGLIVMGTQGYSAIEMVFIGSNTLKVLGASKVPIMSVRTITNKTGYRNIVIPIDSSLHSRQKVNLAIELCRDFGAHLNILGMTDETDSNFEMKLGVIFKQIKELAEKRNVGVSCQLETNISNRAKATLAYTEKVKGDMIIIMSDQDVEYTGIFLGQYEQQIVNFSTVPVLTVIPNEDSDLTYGTPGVAGW
jgi:nucleotide-binding universal stress UspA family protein